MKIWNDEAELIKRCKRELPYNHGSFEILIDRHKDIVYTLCFRLVGSPSESEDLVQEVFTKVFLNLKNFEERSKFSSWVYRIAYNQCMDHILRMKREATKIAEYAEDLERTKRNFVDSRFSEHSEAVLKGLNPEQRAVLIMKYVLGFDLKEISSALEISTAAVKMRLMRAKKDFRSSYSPGDEES